jgi:nucleotide-binding universal stress UspA family protein
MTKTVVVPLDGSERSQRALQPAAWLAKRSGADLHLITTCFSDDTTTEKAFLERSADLLPGDHVTTQVVRPTFPYYGIIETVEGSPEGLLVMSTHGRTGASRVLLGSVADDVMTQTTAPVVLIGPECQPIKDDADELLVCLDDSTEALAALPLAADWAKQLDINARIVNVDDPQRAAVVTPGEGPASDALATLRDADISATFSLLRNGSPARAIVAHAKARHAALIVMMTHSRGGFRARAMGTVTGEVVKHSPCPVLVHPMFV